MNKFKKEKATRPAIDEVLGLLDSFQASSALCAAMELGLFWYLGRGIQGGEDISKYLKLPLNRCMFWLQYLCKLGLLEHSPDGFSVTEETRSSILESYSQDTWKLLAKESMEQYAGFQFLPSHFSYPGSLWEVGGLDHPPMYVERMNKDPDRARQFTRMLFEIHQKRVETIANVLEMSDTNRLMDLGGGSGVLSMALLRRNTHLSAVVVDIPNVCNAGREIANEHSFEDRLLFHPANFIRDNLPTGFDMVIECDVGVYSEELFKKVRKSLNPYGRYVIIDQFAPSIGMAPYSRISWALQGSIIDPEFSYPTAKEIVSKLEESGYHSVSSIELPKIETDSSQFAEDIYLIDSKI